MRQHATCEVQARVLPTSVAFLIVAATLYNGALAVLNAAGLRQSFASVALSEATILALGAGYIAAAAVPILHRLAVTIMVFGVALTVHVTLASGSTAPDCARATLIIGTFLILGSLATEQQISMLFRLMSAIVLVFLVIEIIDTSLYVKIFQPASYYANTRGVEEFSLDNSGLFKNALSLRGRFSFGLSTHRTSSVFVEQVSLANFAGVLCLYILSTFDRLSMVDRALHIATAALIILTNDSRTSSFLALTCLVGYFVYPNLPLRLSFVIMPAVLCLGYAVFSILGPTFGDDFRGRVSTTFRHLENLDPWALFGFGGSNLLRFLDAGYPYVICAATIFGLIFFWFFMASVVPVDTASGRRCLFGLNVLMCTNLMIGGTAVFSIKAAAPLWALVGYVACQGRWLIRASDSVPNTPPSFAIKPVAAGS